MRYIKKIEIENFQSHKHTIIDFVNGLNVITGPSDNGKTAIIRALKWVLYNEPKGSEFIRQGENRCKVSIVLDNDVIITREKYKNKNSYIIIRPTGEEIKFEGFGNDIPLEVLKEHGIRKIYIDPNSIESINIAEQLESPFLLSEPGTIKAKAIGKLIGVHYVDTAIKLVDKDLQKIENQRKETVERIDDLTKKLDEFSNLPMILEKLRVKQDKLSKVKINNERLKKLINLRESLNLIDSEINNIKALLQYFNSIQNAEYKILTLINAINRNSLLINDYNKIKTLEIEIEKLQNILNTIKNIHYVDETYRHLINNVSNFLTMKDINDRLNDVDQVNITINKILATLGKIDDAKEKYSRLEYNYSRLIYLYDKYYEYKKISNSIDIGTNYVKHFMDTDKAILKFSTFLEKLQISNKLNDLYNKYKNIEAEVQQEKKQLKELDVQIDRFIEEYAKLLGHIGKCPVCLSNIEENAINHIINELKGVKLDES